MPQSNQPLFIQIHTLTSYPGTLLNRDDMGFAKRLPFGGATRTRVSSQCLKRHWRLFDGEQAISKSGSASEATELSIRSRQTFERFIVEPLIAEGLSPDLVRAATEAVMTEVLGESAKAKKAKAEVATSKSKKGKADPEEKSDEKLLTNQVTVLGRPEIEFFLTEARLLAQEAGDPSRIAEAKKSRFTKDWGKNLSGLKRAAGLDAALFGRMVTSSKLARSDAAIHVAHAFTVHAEHTESDYFSAMDDLDGGELGSGHIGTTELTSGLFYGYVAIDVAQLVSNLEGCESREWLGAKRNLAAEVSRRLVHVIATVSPGAKLGSTAPHSCAHFVLAEVGTSQPRTLANAFLKPVSAHSDLLAESYKSLADYTSEVDTMYGLDLKRAHAAIRGGDSLGSLGTGGTVASVADFVAKSIQEFRE